MPKTPFNQRNQNIAKIIYNKKVSVKAKIQTGRVGRSWTILTFAAAVLVFSSADGFHSALSGTRGVFSDSYRYTCPHLEQSVASLGG